MAELAEPVVIVVPHLDDAVLSCSTILARRPGATVVTVFAGAPQEQRRGYNAETTQERFAPQAMARRRAEDERALGLFGARSLPLDLFELDYEDRRTDDYPEVVARAVRDAVEPLAPATLVLPLGLMHPDHVLLADAARALWSGPWATLLALDLPYGVGDPYAMAERLQAVTKVAALREVRFGAAPSQKRAAMALYESQYAATRRSDRRAFEATMLGQERFWRVSPRRASASESGDLGAPGSPPPIG